MPDIATAIAKAVKVKGPGVQEMDGIFLGRKRPMPETCCSHDLEMQTLLTFYV